MLVMLETPQYTIYSSTERLHCNPQFLQFERLWCRQYTMLKHACTISISVCCLNVSILHTFIVCTIRMFVTLAMLQCLISSLQYCKCLMLHHFALSTTSKYLLLLLTKTLCNAFISSATIKHINYQHFQPFVDITLPFRNAML